MLGEVLVPTRADAKEGTAARARLLAGATTAAAARAFEGPLRALVHVEGGGDATLEQLKESKGAEQRDTWRIELHITSMLVVSRGDHWA